MDTLDPIEAHALEQLTAAATHFGFYKPRKNPSAGYALALRQLVAAARIFAVKSDEAWAAEVLAAREGK